MSANTFISPYESIRRVADVVEPTSILARSPNPLPSPFAQDESLLLKLPEVLAKVKVSRSNWLAGVKTGRFPPPIRLSPRRVAWRTHDIVTFVHSLEARP